MKNSSNISDEKVLLYIKAFVSNADEHGLSEEELRAAVPYASEEQFMRQLELCKLYCKTHGTYLIDDRYYSPVEAAQKFKNKYNQAVNEKFEETRRADALEQKCEDLKSRIVRMVNIAGYVITPARHTTPSMVNIPAIPLVKQKASILPPPLPVDGYSGNLPINFIEGDEENK